MFILKAAMWMFIALAMFPFLTLFSLHKMAPFGIALGVFLGFLIAKLRLRYVD